jgi:hypothetical protein
MTPEQIMSQLLHWGEVRLDVPPSEIPALGPNLALVEGPYHTDVRASVAYVSNSSGERFRVEVRRG